MNFQTRSSQLFIIGLAAFVALCAVQYGSNGVRGTDQYWYVADVDRLANDQPPVTNNYFPGPMLRNGAVPESNFIMHNGPMLHIVSFLKNFGSSYNVWIVINTLCHFIVAGCIWMAARRISNPTISALTTAAYLLSPIAIWQTINPLLEMYLSALLGLQVLCYFYRDYLLCKIALTCFMAIGVISHPIFVVPAFCWGAMLVIESTSSNRLKTAVVVCCYFIALAYLLVSAGNWFPSSFQPDMRAIVASVVPGKSNMFWHYAEAVPPITTSLMIAKLKAALNAHLFNIRYAPMYVFTNLAIVSTLYLLIFYMKAWWKVLVPLGLFGSQYFAMIVLQQNHPRFQQIVVVVSFLCIAAAMKELGVVAWLQNRWTQMSIAAGFLCLVCCLGFITHVSRGESSFEREQLAKLQQQLQLIPEESRVVGFDLMPHNPFSYIVQPRDILFLRSDMLPDSGAKRAVMLFNPDYYISRGDRVIENAVKIAEFDNKFFGRLLVFRAADTEG